MSDPRIRIILDDGTGTWVTSAPVEGWTAIAVYAAMREAETLFQQNIFRSEKQVEQNLRRAIAKGIE